ncbi:GAF domain-containing protein [uncultured Acetobacteroides sp.]|uniref:GAF domain-containing protein n=1 Tax=uncultured Acetobacteroides sp. TaxID=1760811 RepID=UPI0029F579D0|nr:GAF domain-containing protein [uncultured Acetobacteroides sp.]
MLEKLRKYYQRCSIRQKISISVIGAVGGVLLLVMPVVLIRVQQIVIGYAEQNVVSIGQENAAQTSGSLNEKLGVLKGMARGLESLSGMGSSRFESYRKVIDRTVKEDTAVYAMWYIEDASQGDSSTVNKYIAGGNTGANLASTAKLLDKVEREAGYQEARQSREVAISDPITIDGTTVIGITVPIGSGTSIGAVGLLIKEEFFVRIVRKAMGSDDVACKIISSNGFVVAHPTKTVIGTKLNEGEQTEEILDAIKNGRLHTSYSYSATFGEEAYKVYASANFAGAKSSWSFCTMVPKSTFTHSTNMVALLLLVLMVVGFGVLVVVISSIARAISRPIVEASTELKLIAEGRLSEVKEIHVNAQDEIGTMVSGLNDLASGLKHLAYFAHEVGTGNLDADITAKSDDDAIGKAMVEMKQNLIAAKSAEEERKRIDEIQSWKVAGNARIHEAIRKENTSIKQLCDAVLQEIVSYSNFIQGGLFVVDGEQEGGRFVELVSCIAYNRRKMMDKRISVEEGMVGRCIYEKAPIILTEIPQDYLSISSGLGDRRPDFLALIPLIHNEEVIGVMELSSFGEKEPHVMEYLDKAAEALASAVANVNINERTQRLLDQSKQYSEEMAAQEEELRQNMEEMQAAQEEMHRKTEDYEEMISQLKAELDRRD